MTSVKQTRQDRHQANFIYVFTYQNNLRLSFNPITIQKEIIITISTVFNTRFRKIALLDTLSTTLHFRFDCARLPFLDVSGELS